MTSMAAASIFACRTRPVFGTLKVASATEPGLQLVPGSSRSYGWRKWHLAMARALDHRSKGDTPPERW